MREKKNIKIDLNMEFFLKIFLAIFILLFPVCLELWSEPREKSYHTLNC